LINIRVEPLTAGAVFCLDWQGPALPGKGKNGSGKKGKMGWYRGKLPLAPKERSLGERFFLFREDAHGR